MSVKKEKELEKVIKQQKKIADKYYESNFRTCHPEGKDLARKIFNTIYSNSMLILQDHPNAEVKNAAVAFFTFACTVIDTQINIKFNKDIPKDKLPVIKPTEKRSEAVKSLLKRIDNECTVIGYGLAKNLLDRDFALFFAVVNALFTEKDIGMPLLLTHFRLYTDIMIQHILISEKKQEAHA